MSAANGSPFQINSDFVIFLQHINVQNPHSLRFLHIVSSELKSIIWYHRNRRTFDSATPSTDDIQRHFISTITSRIRVDFERMPENNFKQTWLVDQCPLVQLVHNELQINVT